jgi:predicted nucleic acid-binding protein
MPDSTASAVFFDTNILFYAVSDDSRKASVARSLLADGGIISVQVLNELVNVGRKKMGMDWDEVDRMLGPIHLALRIVGLTVAIHEDGLRIARRYKLALYDAMIVAAALDAGCDTLWSEDLQHGLVIDERLTIRNPFA